jgi:hypothetical protein
MRIDSHRTVRGAAAALLLTACLPVSIARGDQPRPATSPAGVVHAGDIVTVTPWIGRRVTGRLTALAECEMWLASNGQVVRVPFGAVKTLRHHEVRQPNKGAETMLEIADQCRDVECLPAGLFYLGLGAAIHGLDELGHQPKIVYRGKRPPALGAACPIDDRLTMETGTLIEPR